MYISNIQESELQIERYREAYAENHCVLIPDFIRKNVLQHLMAKLERTGFQTKFEMGEMGKAGKVLFVPQDDPVIFAFNLAMNNPELFALIEKITGCEPIGNFIGRIHRSEGGEEHEIKWHSDTSDSRLVAVTLGLGAERYEGGKLQIRKKKPGSVIHEFGQLEPGDAVFFRIDPDLEHRLTILDKGRRTVGVGWFRQYPDFESFTTNYLKPF